MMLLLDRGSTGSQNSLVIEAVLMTKKRFFRNAGIRFYFNHWLLRFCF